jgi:hypothetical protein
MYVGLPDAGQDWHTDTSYREVMGFVNLLYGIRIPRRCGQPLGGTAIRGFEKFWEHVERNKGSGRPPMTAEQRRRPPVRHPVFLTHPITERKVLYCNPGHMVRINALSGPGSETIPAFLFGHQLQQRFRDTSPTTPLMRSGRCAGAGPGEQGVRPDVPAVGAGCTRRSGMCSSPHGHFRATSRRIPSSPCTLGPDVVSRSAMRRDR